MHINPIKFQNQIINAEKPGKAKIKAGIFVILTEGKKTKNAIYRISINQNVRENTEERGRINFPNYASQLQAVFTRSVCSEIGTKILK